MIPRTAATLAAKSPLLKHRKPRRSEVDSEIWAELFVLLEDYGPLWYTEDLHNRAGRALAALKKKKGFSLVRGRTSEKPVKCAALETVTRSQSGIYAVSAAARSNFSES